MLKIVKGLSCAAMAAVFALSVAKPWVAKAEVDEVIPETSFCMIEGVAVESEPVFIQTLSTNVTRIAGIAPVVQEEEAEPEPTMRYLGNYKITGYDTCARCCGKTDGVTASGTQATVGRTCAADKSLPFGTILYIEGIGYRTVEDRGGAIKGGRIDVLCADHPSCYALTGWYDVYVVEE